MIKVKYLKGGEVSPFGFGPTVNAVAGLETDLDEKTALALHAIGWVCLVGDDKPVKKVEVEETKVVKVSENKVVEHKAPAKRGRKSKAK